MKKEFDDDMVHNIKCIINGEMCIQTKMKKMISAKTLKISRRTRTALGGTPTPPPG